MEQQYGLSPRGGKALSKANENAFHSSNLGRHIKTLSSSQEDLTRLDRHQPIIIQNFEILTPSQLKFRRRSLSTANLFLSNASLSRSGGTTPDGRPATTGPGSLNPRNHFWPENGDKEAPNKKSPVTNYPQASLSPSPSSISSKQRATDKPKRVTFSANNTLHPYESDSTTSNFLHGVSKFNISDVRYSSKREASRQFQPFCYPGVGNQDAYNSSSHNDHNNNNHNGINHNNYNENYTDVTTYNGHWVPHESLSHRKGHSNSAKFHLPQRSALKQTSAVNSDQVKQGHFRHDDQGPSGQVNNIQGYSGMHFSNHSASELLTNARMDSTWEHTKDSNSNPNCNQDTVREMPAIDNRICITDQVSAKSIPKDDSSDKKNEIDVKNINYAIEVDEDYNTGIDNSDITSNDIGNNEEEGAEPLPDSDSELFIKDEHVSCCSIESSNDNCLIIAGNRTDTDSNPATSFYNVFGTYDVPDDEYMSSHEHKNPRYEFRNDSKSGQLQTSGKTVTPDGSNPLHKSISIDKSNADQILNHNTSLTTPKVIRLKFLADSSEAQNDIKSKNPTSTQDDSRIEAGINGKGSKYLSEKGSSFSSSLKSSVTSSLRHSKSVTSRQLKTKSTIEAVDLSTLAFPTSERPRSQGDINAQFLMNMYSVSGDRKTAEELDQEETLTSDQDEKQSYSNRPPSRKPTDRKVSFSAEDGSHCVHYRDPLSTSSRGRMKERQLLSTPKVHLRAQRPMSRPLLKYRSSSAHAAMIVTGSKMLGQERVVAAEKFLLENGKGRSVDRTALNRQLEKLIVSKSVSSRVRQTMERSRSDLI